MFETVRPVGCLQSAMVSTYEEWSKDRETMNHRWYVGQPGPINVGCERRLLYLVQTIRKANGAQMTDTTHMIITKVMSQHKVHDAWLRIAAMPMLAPVHHHMFLNAMVCFVSLVCVVWLGTVFSQVCQK